MNDDVQLQLNLKKLNVLAAVAPSTMQNNIVTKLKLIAAYSDKANPTSEDKTAIEAFLRRVKQVKM